MKKTVSAIMLGIALLIMMLHGSVVEACGVILDLPAGAVDNAIMLLVIGAGTLFAEDVIGFNPFLDTARETLDVIRHG